MIGTIQLTQASLLMNDTQQQLKELLGVPVLLFYEIDNETTISTTMILRVVSQVSGISTNDILGKSRTNEVCFCRNVCYHLMFTRLGMSKVAIGKIFNRDHSTIINGLDVIKDETNNNALQDLLKQVELILPKEEVKNEDTV